LCIQLHLECNKYIDKKLLIEILNHKIFYYESILRIIPKKFNLKFEILEFQYEINKNLLCNQLLEHKIILHLKFIKKTILTKLMYGHLE